MKIKLPTFKEEQLLWDKGCTAIVGIDEVGRGAFAGPVVAAGVIFQPYVTFINPLLAQINDSKKIVATKRKELAVAIKEAALCYSIAEISVEIINQVGIGKATQQAFLQVAQTLKHPPDHLLIDAFYVDSITRDIQHPIIHGDCLSISIAAASIIAKVYRDELMESYHTKYPEYNFLENKGYGTAFHRQKLRSHGLTPLHRTSFSLDKFLGTN